LHGQFHDFWAAGRISCPPGGCLWVSGLQESWAVGQIVHEKCGKY